ncbi:MAG: hypothetical protein R3A44_12730 [Caldilineaceae bacterium]
MTPCGRLRSSIPKPPPVQRAIAGGYCRRAGKRRCPLLRQAKRWPRATPAGRHQRFSRSSQLDWQQRQLGRFSTKHDQRGGDFQATATVVWCTGVREHGMGGILNGMAYHGGVIPFGATFFVFLRLPAAQHEIVPRVSCVIYILLDSVGVGEDNPTHQPVEQHLAARHAQQ